jgi:hypothetical protein
MVGKISWYNYTECSCLPLRIAEFEAPGHNTVKRIPYFVYLKIFVSGKLRRVLMKMVMGCFNALVRQFPRSVEREFTKKKKKLQG